MLQENVLRTYPSCLISVAIHMPGPLLSLLNDDTLRYARIAITAFASIYQPLFKVMCIDRNQLRTYQLLDAIKKKIVLLFNLEGHMSIKLAALKAFQKIILVQTRAGDPRPGSTSRPNDAHIGQVSPDHPFIKIAALETEATERLTQVVTVIFTSSNPDLVMASMNSLATLAKFRPSLSPIVFEALISWTPSGLTSVSYTLVRSVEKTLRLLYLHFHPSRNAWSGSYASQIIEAVDAQKMRMESAAKEEEERRERDATVKRERLGEEINGASKAKGQKRKRVRFAEEDEEQSATPQPPVASTSTSGRLPSPPPPNPEVPQADSADLAQGRLSANAFRQSSSLSGEANPLASFDVTTLPHDLVVELILANLQALTDQDLENAISRTRSSLNDGPREALAPPPLPPPVRPGPPPLMPKLESAAPKGEFVEEQGAGQMDLDEEIGPLDPLKLDVGDEEVLEEVERNLEQEGAHDGQGTSTALATFTLQPPGELQAEDCRALMQTSVSRICENGAGMEGGGRHKSLNETTEDTAIHTHLWSMLVIRLATRGFDEGDQHIEQEDILFTWKRQSDTIRQIMHDFVVADFANRIEFAIQWLAEEFYCEVVRRKRGIVDSASNVAYAEWLHKLVGSLGATLDGKDRTMMDFLNRLPHIPDTIVDTLEVLCLDKAKMRIGFGMLRELAIQRQPLRDKICSILLRLTRNEEKTIRSAAIITVRNWVRGGGGGGSSSEAGPRLEETVLDSAREGLRRLTVRNNRPPYEDKKDESQVKIEVQDDEEEAEIPAPVSALDDPTKEVTESSDVVRLVELPFALCVRVSSMLDEIFEVFTKMSPGVQEAVKKIIVPLIQTLGPNNTKLLSLVRRHPPGSESLAVAVFIVMTEKQKSKKVVDLVKEMAEEKSDIDPRFLIPILPDLVKSEIIKYLPRVVTILASEKPEDRATIKAVFTSIVTMPAQGFGSISTNLPRVRSSELLSPVELMSLLHHSEREIGLKTTAEAIRICFGMTDIFRSEVLGAVLNLILEEVNLPVLFMRTAIMAVRTYKSLSSYISTIFLSRLIIKKVWQHQLLWDGFVLCAKQTAPASFGALIQLPKEQLRDVITKQPDLRTGLREHLVKKAGGHKGRLKNFLELLGEDESVLSPATVNENATMDSPNIHTPDMTSSQQPTVAGS